MHFIQMITLASPTNHYDYASRTIRFSHSVVYSVRHSHPEEDDGWGHKSSQRTKAVVS